MQLFFTHLPDEHLEQAANHEQRIVRLPDEQLTAEEKWEQHTQSQNRYWVKNRNPSGERPAKRVGVCPRFTDGPQMKSVYYPIV